VKYLLQHFLLIFIILEADYMHWIRNNNNGLLASPTNTPLAVDVCRDILTVNQRNRLLRTCWNWKMGITKMERKEGTKVCSRIRPVHITRRRHNADYKAEWQ